MNRYPYTEAADALRMQAVDPYGPGNVSLSRAQASQIRQYIAAAIGMDAHELACRIADHAAANKDTHHG